MITIADAITAIKADARFYIENNNFSNIEWLEGTTPISETDINLKITELETAKTNEATAQANLKASARAKLIAGEALTEDEANTIVL